MLRAKIVFAKDIDLKAYGDLLATHSRACLYAQPWYLSVAAQGNWAAIVFYHQESPKIYKAVIPFCFKRKLGFVKIVYMPLLVQQLGLFASADVLPEERLSCIKQGIEMLRNFAFKVYYAFNEDDFPLCEQLAIPFASKVNQLIASKNAELLWQDISSTKRKHIKRGAAVPFFRVANCTAEQVVEAFRAYRGAQMEDLSAADYQRVLAILEAIDKNAELRLHLIYENEADFLLQKEPLLALAWAVMDGNTIVHLFGGPSERGKRLYIQDAVIFSALSELSSANSSYFFDFEGSNMLGIQQYNAAFGAEKRYYAFYAF